MFPFGGTKKWDSCAVEAILIEAGGACTQMNGEPIWYDESSNDFNNANGFIGTVNTALHLQLLNKLDA